MRVYRDQDADLGVLKNRRIAVIGYGNQGRAQALNLRDSGLEVLVGNMDDAYGERAREDGFALLPIAEAAAEADIVMMLIPDEVVPAVFTADIAPHLVEGKVLVFASGYNIAFDLIRPPTCVDVVLVAPRMIGDGVRELYLAGRGFPSFVGVAQDHSGLAKKITLALAKGIGSTRAGVVEVTFAEEAELDLFTEQCFFPAFSQVLTTAVGLMMEEGYPPYAVLLELYMSGELSYVLGKIAELGMFEQSTLHSRTSQYGSLSRAARFVSSEVRARMCEGLEEIRSGRFAQEWTAEQAAGCPTLRRLRKEARSHRLNQMERELRQALAGGVSPAATSAWASTGNSREDKLYTDLVEVVTELYATGLITATGGNVSVRFPERDQVLITPSQLFKGDLHPDVLVRIDLDGTRLDPDALSPSSEWPMHCAIYKARPDVGAIIHTHAPQATVLGLADIPFLPISTGAAFLGDLPRVPYIPPGTQDLAQATVEALADGAGVLLMNHGLLVAASDLRKAANISGVIEWTAGVILGCYALGQEPPTLPEDVIPLLRQMGKMIA
jgi:ketol-acid reductoisomerase